MGAGVPGGVNPGLGLLLDLAVEKQGVTALVEAGTGCVCDSKLPSMDPPVPPAYFLAMWGVQNPSHPQNP